MTMDYAHRSKAWVDDHYRRTKARGGVGWADISDKNRQAAKRLASLVREHGTLGGRVGRWRSRARPRRLRRRHMDGRVSSRGSSSLGRGILTRRLRWSQGERAAGE